MDNQVLFFCVVWPAIVIIGIFIGCLIVNEWQQRKQLNLALQTNRQAFKNCLKKVIKETGSKTAKITYQAYFAERTDHTADGFIDGDE